MALGGQPCPRSGSGSPGARWGSLRNFYMKKTILTVASVLSFLIAPAPAFALFNVNQGGTGQSTFTSGALLYGNGTSPIATTAAGTLGYVLQFNGTFPTWVSTSSLGIVPGGSDGEVQFNDNGIFGGNSGFIYRKDSHELGLEGNLYMGPSGDSLYFLKPGTSMWPAPGLDDTSLS
jgi:hypothetical protein